MNFFLSQQNAHTFSYIKKPLIYGLPVDAINDHFVKSQCYIPLQIPHVNMATKLSNVNFKGQKLLE